MKVDFLTPGDWRDPYESRIIEEYENVGNWEFPVLMYLQEEKCKKYWDLFPVFYVYLDGTLTAAVLKHEGKINITIY